MTQKGQSLASITICELQDKIVASNVPIKATYNWLSIIIFFQH